MMFNGSAGTPASPAQRGVWITEQAGAAGTAYAMPLLLRFDGDLNVPALLDSCAAVVARHPALASAFEERDDGLWMAPAGTQPPVTVVDLTAGPTVAGLPDAWHGLDKHLAEEVRRPFDLRHGPLTRFTLFAVTPRHHVLAVVAHHLVFDGMSKDVLIRDLAEAYNAAAGRGFGADGSGEGVAAGGAGERRGVLCRAMGGSGGRGVAGTRPVVAVGSARRGRPVRP
jgi:hypothetical protein